MKRCHNCLKELDIRTHVGRKDVCPSCGSDLRCCLNCLYHAPGTYNACREPQADRVVEKDRSNFCDYFILAEDGSGSSAKDPESAKNRLDALFK